VTRGQLGALIQDLNEELAQSFEYSSTDGVLVGDVLEGGAAAKAGLKPGDIIVQLNGRKMTSANQLRNAIAATAPETDVTLEIFRDGKSQKLTVRLGELSDTPLAQSRTSPAESTDELGMTVQPMTPDLAQQLGYESDQGGVVVTIVTPGNIASRLGLQRGDVILAIGEKTINSLADYREALQDQNLKQGVRLHVMREGTRRFLFLKIG
jgi:serine protease Do